VADKKHILNSFDHVYFLGIGGIGMSALAKYFLSIGKAVAGYDKSTSAITANLIDLGANIHYDDDVKFIPTGFLNKENTLIIRTPAVPGDHSEYTHFQENDFNIMKRAEVLGEISKKYKCLGVAGTHGKTTTSTLLAHLLNQSSLSFNAFLGGISTNFGTNFIANEDAEFTVIEADEFDRSFLQLRPYASIITSADPDHLDIYGDAATFLKGFEDYANLHNEDALLILQHDLKLSTKSKTLSYGLNDCSADYRAINIRVEAGRFVFDMIGQDINWQNIILGLPGIHNVENALACAVLCHKLGLSESEIRLGMKSFKGVKRRFETHLLTDKVVYIDDYAHHPTAIKALVESLRLLHPNKKILGVFQPHLFSRTKDFMDAFAEELSKLDECILLPIYPAREKPIEAITSEALAERMSLSTKVVNGTNELYEELRQRDIELIVTIGAGDIDRLIEPIQNLLQS
jgi:UDP-N-acetylmuramate--alanine ligase